MGDTISFHLSLKGLDKIAQGKTLGTENILKNISLKDLNKTAQHIIKGCNAASKILYVVKERFDPFSAIIFTFLLMFDTISFQLSLKGLDKIAQGKTLGIE
tara:strand:- start:470 stop:772 length:303 start_codon:yes stop_codon:yes gene_type:complete